MRQLKVMNGEVEVRTAAPGEAGSPIVHLKTTRDGAGVDVSLTAAQAHALSAALTQALTDPKVLWDGSHEGHHPPHDPMANPDTLSHRPSIGGAMPGGTAEPGGLLKV